MLSEKRTFFMIVLGCILLLGAAAAWLAVIRPTMLRFRQVGVLTDLVAYTSALRGYHEQHGGYPLELEKATGSIDWFSPIDRWGAPILYLSDGDGFVLASMGLGGQPDGENYLAARLRAPRQQADFVGECSNLQVDQIVTDRGWYRGCGK